MASGFWTEKISIFSTSSLEELLGKNPDGHFVLQKKKQLDNSSRQKLVKIIVDDLILHNQNNNKFPIILQSAATEIIKLFPHERIETYFIPYSKEPGTTVKTPARGKLYSRWVNLKRALTLAKDVKSPEERSKRPISNAVTISDVEIENFNFLLNSNEKPYQDIKKAWIVSFQLRRQKMKSRESPLSYFDFFPALKHAFGYQLLIEDFNMMYPKAAELSIYSIWPKIGSCIIDLLKQKNSALPETETLLIDLHVKSLKLFPYLFTPCVLHAKYGNKKRIKFSRSVMADRFFSIVSTFESLESKIIERKENLKEFGVNLQPYMLAVGHPQNILAYFVVLGNQRYMVKDCLAALDITFKIFHALDLPYPSENYPVWQCIDYFVYQINRSVKPAASVVIGEIEQRLKDM